MCGVTVAKLTLNCKKITQIVNEDLVQDVLIASGFEVHYFEDYTFQQQVEIMSGAKLVVALHGAGITNILFMGGKGRILELRNDNDSHNNYRGYNSHYIMYFHFVHEEVL